MGSKKSNHLLMANTISTISSFSDFNALEGGMLYMTGAINKIEFDQYTTIDNGFAQNNGGIAVID